MFGVLSTLQCVSITDHQAPVATPWTAPKAGTSGPQTDPGRPRARSEDLQSVRAEHLGLATMAMTPLGTFQNQASAGFPSAH